MITLVDEQLEREARHFRLAFACPSCAEFDPKTRACSLGFPNHDHIDERLEDRREVVFCKTFELV